jgi:5-bromo-4-chloroindolyl phosphate hydrolysis protein
MADTTHHDQSAFRNTLTVIGVIVTVVVLAVSISLNAIQASAIEQLEETRAIVRDHEVRIRENSETLVEIRYIRQQLDRIEEQLKELRKSKESER